MVEHNTVIQYTMHIMHMYSTADGREQKQSFKSVWVIIMINLSSCHWILQKLTPQVM